MKKLGLSALAGSLVAFSANAAELSVSGGVELTYVDTGGNTGNEVTGNSYGANSSVTLSGSGDVGFGTVSATRTLNDTNGGWGSSFQTLDMGDMGVLSFDSTGGALVGITANDDLLPTAYEEAWTGVSGSGISGVGSTNVIGYRNTFGMLSVSAGYTQNGSQTAESASGGAGNHGSITDIYVSVSPIDGLTVGAAIASTDSATSTDADNESTAFVTYAVGPMTFGLQMSEINTVGNDAVSTMYGVAININENASVSYNARDVELGDGTGTTKDQEDRGIAASYTMGSMTVSAFNNAVDNAGGTANKED